jgi:hypothetical protein
MNHATHTKYRHGVSKVIIWDIMHPCPGVNGGVVVPWTKLIDDYLSLVDNGLKQEVRRKQGVSSMTHSNNNILGVPDSTLRRILSMDARWYEFNCYLELV